MDTISELCPWCDDEVELEELFAWQTCPSCQQPIKPCALCNWDEVNCQECKLDFKGKFVKVHIEEVRE